MEKTEKEDAFVNRLLIELNKLGYDTTNIDGDEAPEVIIAKWFHTQIDDLKVSLELSEGAHDITLTSLVNERIERNHTPSS